MFKNPFFKNKGPISLIKIFSECKKKINPKITKIYILLHIRDILLFIREKLKFYFNSRKKQDPHPKM